jgi:hypothetical protein
MIVMFDANNRSAARHQPQINCFVRPADGHPAARAGGPGLPRTEHAWG